MKDRLWIWILLGPGPKKNWINVPEKAWPETARHVTKADLPLTEVLATTPNVTACSGTVPEVFRFDYAEQAVKHQLRNRKMRSHFLLCRGHMVIHRATASGPIGTGPLGELGLHCHPSC